MESSNYCQICNLTYTDEKFQDWSGFPDWALAFDLYNVSCFCWNLCLNEVYINDLPQNIQSQVRLFADDTAVYLTITSSEDANTLQADLDTLQEWERIWDMGFNPNKCQVLYITRSRQPLQSQYTLHGQFLESVDSAKYLGVNISQDLNWNHHINEITGKANRTSALLKEM